MVTKSGVLLRAKIRILRQELIGTASCRDGFLLSKCSPGASIPMTRMSLGWVAGRASGIDCHAARGLMVVSLCRLQLRGIGRLASRSLEAIPRRSYGCEDFGTYWVSPRDRLHPSLLNMQLPHCRTPGDFGLF